MQSDSSSNVTSTNNNSSLGRLLIPRSQRRKFFLVFTCMTIMGWVVGGIASIALERIILGSLPPAIAVQSPIWVRLLTSVVFAVVFGADQALALRLYLSGWLWMLATSVGWVVANSVAMAWSNYISSIAASLNEALSPEITVILGLLSTISYILSGIWLGLFQWLVLRRYTAGAWWWTFLPAVAFFLISVLIWLLSLIQYLIPEVIRTGILYLSEQGFTAIILGIIPAIGLCTLKRNSQRQREVSAG
ncbi:hypothetical protein I8748_13845 [Nostoc sp. CENA67]|uniref:Uncharacterized protein n=1 Tax=Amazonocrinis nigriterrae CENA67 TaxID=2794033 RepID=A0A8J7HTX4_9NOST|nr:hypothetical protein [Amazonocrinis nigriterrae]MBH8563255.1 hypothetical protein [Amazonocrinis nigriterrae CENA67]